MGIASLVLGIVSIIVGFIPFCGAIAFIPAIIGIILGIVDIVKKKKTEEKKGMAIAGLILSIIAVVVIGVWTLITSIGLFTTAEVAESQGVITKSKNSADVYKDAANYEKQLLDNLNVNKTK